jgi:hypothetical protein
MSNENDIWQVELDGAFYEADTETLAQWVRDGYVTPATRVKKGRLKWIEMGRVPPFRGTFPVAAPPPPEPPASSYADALPSYGSAPYATPAHGSAPYAAPAFDAPASVGTVACAQHPGAPVKFVCQSCGANLCSACVTRYGSSAAVCSLCGQLCAPFAEAQRIERKTVDRYSAFGLGDFAAAFAYPLQDPLAFGLKAVFYGVLILFGAYGRFFAAGILFASMSFAIRRVAMGAYDEGPSPDLSDPGEWAFEAAKLGIAVTLVVFGPLFAVVFFFFSGDFSGGLSGIAALGASALVALAWAAFYYPMALLVAGYTADFVSVVNPLVGIMTMKQMGVTYVKAYAMCIFILVLQSLVAGTLSMFDARIEELPALVGGVIFLVLAIVKGAGWFYASMVMAAILGLAVYKKADALGVYIQ